MKNQHKLRSKASFNAGATAFSVRPGEATILPFKGASLALSPGAVRRARVRGHVHHVAYKTLKRLADIIVCAAGLILLAPLLALVWVLVRATSPGPGLYWSERVGRHGVLFWMPKFRTMTVDAPQGPREALLNATMHITPLGAVLRRLSADELPQLWCIFTGEMSLIGPRPLLASDPGAEARTLFHDALSVRPGLSGLSQVMGRNGVGPRRKARLDAFYARKASIGLDVSIFLRTLLILLTGHGFL